MKLSYIIVDSYDKERNSYTISKLHNTNEIDNFKGMLPNLHEFIYFDNNPKGYEVIRIEKYINKYNEIEKVIVYII